MPLRETTAVPRAAAPAPTGPRHAGGGRDGGRFRALRGALVLAWPALAVYALVRIAGTAFIAWRAGDDGPGLGKLFASRFDTVYYVHIADKGYEAPLAEGCAVQGELCTYAFFPAYPALIRGFSAVLPLPTGTVAWGISVVASLVAAWGIFAVAEQLIDRRAAVFAVALWGVVPHAVVQQMAYTESLFTAVSAWALYAVVRRHWLTAAALACLAGLTRPSGAAVVAPVVLGAAWALFTAVRKGTGGRTALAAAILIAPLGWFFWFARVGYRAGRWDGYFRLQERWGSTFDGGGFTADRIAEVFTKQPTHLNTVVATVTVLGALLLLLLCALDRQHAPLLIYSAFLLLIAAGGAGYFHSKARFLLPAFPLLFPLAKALATARPRAAYTVLGAVVVLSSAYGGYLLLVWKYSP
ncbi:glycosyltransferase family 39 protein [Streptomyces tsukubensis]|uniref:glycosyltransferase family 39 protein n=1 Tax=Streptomyces tsukubensis TaxID=83656 RepID=UPI00344C634C